MWPFKKKTPLKVLTPEKFKTVICIPGTWNNWEEFIHLIVSENNLDYIAAGGVLMNVKENKHFGIEFCERDEKMKEAFKFAGMFTLVSEDFITNIDNHKHNIYISAETGNLEDAKAIASAAASILKAGGIGIKIETTGKAFEKDKWLQLIDTFEESSLYEMFVVDSITYTDGTVYSCGMQNLGYKDTIVSGLDFQESVDLISIFSYYQIIDKPIITNNQTFSTAIDSPKFLITNETNYPNKGDELFGNPDGMWRLEKVAI